MRRVVPENGAVQRGGVDEEKRRGQREKKDAQRLPGERRRCWCVIRDRRLVAASRRRSDLSPGHLWRRGVTERVAESRSSEHPGCAYRITGAAGTEGAA